MRKERLDHRRSTLAMAIQKMKNLEYILLIEYVTCTMWFIWNIMKRNVGEFSLHMDLSSWYNNFCHLHVWRLMNI